MNELNLKIEQYEGPLDLLLSLIAKQKLNIFDIPIADISDQYMAYIDSMRALDMEVTSEFILMAAELMLIKSRMLLPKAENTEDPRKQLVDILVEYQRAKNAAEFLRKQSELYFDRYTKQPDEGDGIYMREHAVGLLTEAFIRIKQREAVKPKAERVKLFDKIGNEYYYTVEEKVIAIITMLSKSDYTAFLDIFYKSTCINETVAIFLALLELVKDGNVGILRDKGEIFLYINDTNEDDDNEPS